MRFSSMDLVAMESNNSEDCVVRFATAEDIDSIRKLVLEHGTTEWSSFPEQDLENHLVKVASGAHHAILAFSGEMLVGMVSFAAGDFFQEYEPELAAHQLTGYIVEALVHPDFCRRGIATRLLLDAVETLVDDGVSRVYAKRHEQNTASEALLRKNGFQKIDVFSDVRRTTGSGRTVIERFRRPS